MNTNWQRRATQAEKYLANIIAHVDTNKRRYSRSDIRLLLKRINIARSMLRVTKYSESLPPDSPLLEVPNA